MKKTILLAAAMLPVALFAQNDQYEIVRGNKVGGNCQGNIASICDTGKITDAKNSIMTVSKINSRQILFSINVLKLSEEEQTSWLGKPLKEVKPEEEIVFDQQNSVALNTELIRDLKLEVGFIAKGTHSIKLSKDNTIEILLNLSEK